MDNLLPISGFWSRVGAFLIDTVLLGILGILLGLVFRTQFIALGDQGNLVGWIVALSYFSVMNSSICGGQTIGKRILRIQLVDASGATISYKRSLIRTLVLITPFFLNGFRFPGISLTSVISIIQAIIVFSGICGAIVFFIFNKQTRQTFHDLAAGSFVINKQYDDQPYEVPKIGRTPKIALVVVGIMMIGTVVFIMNRKSQFEKLTEVADRLNRIEGVSRVKVIQVLPSPKDKEGNVVNAYKVSINIISPLENSVHDWTYIKEIPEVQKAMRVVLDSDLIHQSGDIVQLNISQGYDIGIARMSNSISVGMVKSDWMAFVYE